jgi:nitroreductase
MSFNQIISTRRSVKNFIPDYPLGENEVTEMIENAMLAPTSFNIQHWRFIRVTDKSTRRQLREAAWDQAQVTDASELFVITADIDAWKKQPERYWANADKEKQTFIVNMLTDFYRERDWLQRDEAIRSGSLAAQNLMLSARSKGYDACPMIGFDQDKVAQIIRLPKDHVIVMMVAVGKAADKAWPRGGQLPLQEVLIENGF